MGEQDVGESLLQPLPPRLEVELSLLAIVLEKSDEVVYLLPIGQFGCVDASQQFLEVGKVEMPDELSAVLAETVEERGASDLCSQALALVAPNLGRGWLLHY
jgi:hypothetical protein